MKENRVPTSRVTPELDNWGSQFCDGLSMIQDFDFQRARRLLSFKRQLNGPLWQNVWVKAQLAQPTEFNTEKIVHYGAGTDGRRPYF